ncbi:MAG: flagellar M-ring protein FliF [Zoogloeaceae bacterium]|nr:flagellar M-ring protein FliF [Zoogloeaceae bacterium]
MATADTLAAPPSPFQTMAQNIAALSQRQKMAMGAALAIAVALLVGVFLWSRQPDYAVLFSNLEERDGGAIVNALTQQNIPYRFSTTGGAILVPANQVHDVRLKLAAQGLPRGGMVGFELMENQKLGVSQFHEQVNFQRALEGELARTIQAVAAVASARVHLAIPKQTAFLRDEQKPTASVLVNLHSGRRLEPTQVAGIVHLVASSVPHLANDAVSIVDQNGNLLTVKQDPLRAAGLDPTQLKYVQELEDSYIKRIDAILTPVIGEGNFKAQVTADVDFNQTEQTAETFKPNPPPDQQAIRSQQSSESTTREPGPQGVPGALSNQPPVPATAPITTPPAPGTPTGANGAQAATPPLSSNRSSTVNYEVDRTIQHTRVALGAIKRLSVAVVLNHRSETDPAGKTKTAPLSDAEIKQITDLVREAMGFSAQRGDSLNVASSPFAAVPREAPPETPVWKDPDVQDVAKEALKYLIILGVLTFIAFGIIRPLLKTVMPPPPEPETGEAEAAEAEGTEEGEATISPEAIAANDYETRLAKIKEMAHSDPRAVAGLIKEWIGAGGEGKK